MNHGWVVDCSFHLGSRFLFMYLYLFEIKTSQRHQHAGIQYLILSVPNTGNEKSDIHKHPD